MDIRKIISEEVKKVFSENYPWGTQHDPNAPWNQVDNTRSGDRAKQITYKLLWSDDREFAFFRGPDGNVYVLYVDSIDKDDLEPYADREETYLGKDEDGFPDFEYGDWEITGDVLLNYVNDSIGSMKIGKGLEDYESGEYDLVMLDDELRQDLLSIAKYIKNDKQREEFVKIVSGQVSEGGVTDQIVDKKTMDTPTGNLFIMNVAENELKGNNIRRNK